MARLRFAWHWRTGSSMDVTVELGEPGRGSALSERYATAVDACDCTVASGDFSASTHGAIAPQRSSSARHVGLSAELRHAPSRLAWTDGRADVSPR